MKLIFTLFGLDIFKRQPTRVEAIIVWTAKTFIMIIHIYIVAVLVTFLQINSASRLNFKVAYTKITNFATNFTLWCILYRQEGKISDAVMQLLKLCKFHQILHSSKFPFIIILIILLMYIFLLLCVLYVTTQEEYVYLFPYLLLGAQNITNGLFSKIYLIFSNIIYHGYYYFFPNLFVAMYTILCYYMSLMLRKYADKNKIQRPFLESMLDICNQRFMQYHTMIAVFEMFEYLMSLPILLCFMFNISNLFMHLSYIVIHANESILKRYLLVADSFITMTVIAISAASVNEADKMAKQSNIKLLKETVWKGVTLNQKEIVEFWTMSSTPPFTFTGWGLFKFTKNFYLNALGYIVTYTFLIFNL